MEGKYQKIKGIVENELLGADPVHDVSHVTRVYNLCLKLAEGEKNIDLDIIKLAALLHDIGGVRELQDKSGKTDHAKESAKMALEILKRFNFSEDKIKQVIHCILAHRYRSGGLKPKTQEARILFDADKLDALGVIGLARAYAWIGRNNAKLYSDISLKEYIKDNIVGKKINGRIKDKTKHNPFIEFELKLKHLPQRLFTVKAKILARQRLAQMEHFFDILKQEIRGEK